MQAAKRQGVQGLARPSKGLLAAVQRKKPQAQQQVEEAQGETSGSGRPEFALIGGSCPFCEAADY